MEIAFGILGRTALRIGGNLHEDWGTPRVHAVLATLLVHVPRAVPIDTLVEWAWPEESPTPRNRVSTAHTYATRVRRTLTRLSPQPTLHTGNGTYRLDIDKSLIDYHYFKSLISQARMHARARDPLQAAEYAQQALELWRGRPLDDLSSEPAEAWRTRVLRDEWLPANALLLEALIEVGRFDEALARLNDIQADHPDDIALAKLRLSTLYGLARFPEATPYYLDLRRRLLDDAEDEAAEHLRSHYESLKARAPEPDVAQLTEPLVAPRQLPHDIPDFVGREDLLQALDAATQRGGVVILDGMAGVGKTAVAVHWAHLARDRFPDGDFFVNLNGFADSASVSRSTVVDDFLIAVGRPPNNGMTQRAKELLLSRLLAEKSTLVILDNALNTAHVRDLIALLSGALIIVTSRQRLTTLASAGARTVRVEPMTTTEAAELLAVRLSARRQIAGDDRTRLVELCGGLPLVITVLAEQVATRSAAQLSAFAQQLDRRQLIEDIGVDGDGSVNARTLFTWSYRALLAAEQRLFRLLAVHPGQDISAEAASACDGRPLPDTRRGLNVLESAHLLERAEALDHYRFHDLLREFATQCVERDKERSAAERRMVSYYLDAATRAHHTLYPGHATAPEFPVEPAVRPASFADPAQARSWFDRERKSLLATIHFAAARGHHDQAWRLAATAATFLDRRGYYADGRAVLELAVSSAAAAGDREAEASCQVELGMELMILGDNAAARRCFDAGLRYAEETGSDIGRASALHQLARLEMQRGDTAAAIAMYRRGLEPAQRIDEHGILCWTHVRLGEALLLMDRHDEALLHLHTSEFHALRIGDASAHASGLALIGAVYRDRGDHPTAIACCEKALGIVDAMPMPDLAITTQISTTLAEINLAKGDTDSATRHALLAVALAQRTHSAAAEARARDVLGNAHMASGDRQDAADAWQHAATLFEQVGSPVRASAVRRKFDTAPPAVDVPASRSSTAPSPTRSHTD